VSVKTRLAWFGGIVATVSACAVQPATPEPAFGLPAEVLADDTDLFGEKRSYLLERARPRNDRELQEWVARTPPGPIICIHSSGCSEPPPADFPLLSTLRRLIDASRGESVHYDPSANAILVHARSHVTFARIAAAIRAADRPEWQASRARV